MLERVIEDDSVEPAWERGSGGLESAEVGFHLDVVGATLESLLGRFKADDIRSPAV